MPIGVVGGTDNAIEGGRTALSGTVVAGKMAAADFEVHRAFDDDPARRLPTLAETTVFDADPLFRPVRRRDGYVVLQDMGLLGDGTMSALVGLDGSIRGCAFRALTPSRCLAGT